MPNDDLGQFPMPSKPAVSDMVSGTQDTSTTNPMDNQTPPTTTAQTFEATPEEIPSAFNQTESSAPVASPAPIMEESPVPPVTSEAAEITSPFVPKEEPMPQPLPANPQPTTPQPIPATIPPSSGLSMGPIIFAVIFIVAVISLAGAAFLFQQTKSLQGQLADITKTLEKQKTTPETTPTPSVVEVPSTTPTVTVTPTPSVIATISATPTVSLTPTPTAQVYVPGSPLRPLSVASKVMQIAIKHQPNAQLILLKTENANDPIKATTKYFFRQDLTTKKYFYVLISGTNEPEVIDKQIYVTPDDNIPSLNDLVLQDNLGIDLDEAIAIVKSSCPDENVCTNAQAKAQYIKTTAGVIWQINLTVAGKTQPMVMQINAQTKTILFKTEDFTK